MTPISPTLARAPAPQGTDSLRAVAEQFEALFTHMLFKNMRAGSLGDGLFDSEQGKLYQDMMDREMADALSRQGGLGIADMLVQQLGSGATQTAAPLQAKTSTEMTLPQRALPVRRHNIASSSMAAAQARQPTDGEANTAIEFVKSVWPLAKRAAGALGISPKVIVAQAALETGWGRHVIQHDDGRSAHNLFGIKADRLWQGERVSVATTEVLGGVARRVMAAFRAYASPAEGIEDYKRLMSTPRYREALDTQGNERAFAEAIQNAGYATDPAYADKILAIANGTTLTSALKALKSSPE
ncbi:MAG: flagellar assembly peptidoglycan hydrolase FlgJ [Pseudomonadota bacterium]